MSNTIITTNNLEQDSLNLNTIFEDKGENKLTFVDILMYAQSVDIRELNSSLENTMGSFFDVKHNLELNKIILQGKGSDSRWEGFSISLRQIEQGNIKFQILDLELPEKFDKKTKIYLEYLINFLKDKYDFNTNIVSKNNIFQGTLDEDSDLENILENIKTQERTQEKIDELTKIAKSLRKKHNILEAQEKILNSIGIDTEGVEVPDLILRIKDKIFDLDIGAEFRYYIYLSQLIENKLQSIVESEKNNKIEDKSLKTKENQIIEKIKIIKDKNSKQLLLAELSSIRTNHQNYKITNDTSSFDNSMINIFKEQLKLLEEKIKFKIQNYKLDKNIYEVSSTLLKSTGTVKEKSKKGLLKTLTSFFSKAIKPKAKSSFPDENQDFLHRFIGKYIDKKYLDKLDKSIIDELEKYVKSKNDKFIINPQNLYNSDLKQVKTIVNIENEDKLDFDVLAKIDYLMSEKAKEEYQKAENEVKNKLEEEHIGESYKLIHIGAGEFIVLLETAYYYLIEGNSKYFWVYDYNEKFGGVEVNNRTYYNIISDDNEWKVIYFDGDFKEFKVESENENEFKLIQLGEYDENLSQIATYEEIDNLKFVIGYARLKTPYGELHKDETRILLNSDLKPIKTENGEYVGQIIQGAELKFGFNNTIKVYEISLSNGGSWWAKWDGKKFYDLKYNIEDYYN